MCESATSAKFGSTNAKAILQEANYIVRYFDNSVAAADAYSRIRYFGVFDSVNVSAGKEELGSELADCNGRRRTMCGRSRILMLCCRYKLENCVTNLLVMSDCSLCDVRNRDVEAANLSTPCASASFPRLPLPLPQAKKTTFDLC